MKVLLDSNVLFSALFFEGNECMVLRLVSAGKVRGVISEYILKEVARVADAKSSQKVQKLPLTDCLAWH